MPNIDEQLTALSRRAERILSEDELRRKLERAQKTGKPLRIKIGLDPTAPDVTLGHAVPLSIVRQFQEWGHKAVIIIGDYTARVGDPTGRNELRPKLEPAQIDANAKTYVAQIGKILLTDPAHLEVRYNGEWLGRMTMMDVIALLARKTVAQLLAREDFHERFTNKVDIHLHELMYPLLQGWDSVMIDADVEMGGSDQLFNNLVGREFQKEQGKEPQVVIVTPLLVGTDGAIKMSKSKGNYIAVTDPPAGNDGMYGKVMSLPDALMESYYQLLTELPMDDVRTQIKSNPNEAKQALARHMVTWLHGAEPATQAQADWDRRRKHEAPDEMPELTVGAAPQKLAPVIVKAGLAASNGEAIRKIKEGAVQLDGEKVTDFQREYTFDKPTVLKLGRKYARLKP
jgi:tyrosyl-tRNA synthetase